MLSQRRPFLPEWRHWPMIPILTLFTLAIWGVLAYPSPPPVGHGHTTKINSAKEAINGTHTSTGGWTAEDYIAVFTGFTVLIFLGQLYVAWRTDSHFRIGERAYVKMSHYPPGIYWEMPRKFDALYDKDKDLEYWIRAKFRMKNFGRTPANIIRVCVARKIVPKNEKLPEQPDYSDGMVDTVHSFLVTEDEFEHPVRIRIAKEDMEALWKVEKKLYVFGYVEYLDKFEQRHRGRYARQYEPTRDPMGRPITFRPGELLADQLINITNNLPFIDQSGYNDDITQRRDGKWPNT